jgi:hypothetical protein
MPTSSGRHGVGVEGFSRIPMAGGARDLEVMAVEEGFCTAWCGHHACVLLVEASALPYLGGMSMAVYLPSPISHQDNGYMRRVDLKIDNG